MRFFVYINNECIGWSKFEHGDPPMGVVFGVFYPGVEYEKVKSSILERQLRVKSEEGFEFHPVAGTHIADHFDEWPNENAREISMLGLPYEEYRRYFAEYHQRYEEDMRKRAKQ